MGARPSARLGRDSLDTHDLVQETLSHVAGRIQNFEPRHKAAFQAYLRQAVLNRVRDHIRRAEASGKRSTRLT